MPHSTGSHTEIQTEHEPPKPYSVMPEAADMEKQASQQKTEPKKSVYAGLGWLDRLLVLWILLAIIIGILLGNFVDNVGPALQKGKFVGVSVPIGEDQPILLSLGRQ